MSANTVNLDQLFGSLNLANTIINGDFSGFELVYYTDTLSKDFTEALNESHFSDQSRGMRFLIQEWPKTISTKHVRLQQKIKGTILKNKYLSKFLNNFNNF